MSKEVSPLSAIRSRRGFLYFGASLFITAATGGDIVAKEISPQVPTHLLKFFYDMSNRLASLHNKK